MGSLTVLVVEDEPSIADTLVYALGTEGFNPLMAATAGEARKLLEAQQVGFIVLDLGLPDSTGFDFLKEIRRKYAIPLMVLTARSEEVDRIVGLELGADDYLCKPFSPRELTTRIKTILRRTENPAPAESLDNSPQGGSENPFVINDARMEIRYRGRLLELSRYEYRLLRVLAASPGRVYTRQTLMELAWEEPDMSLDRTVDTHIKTLRAKLRKHHPKDDPIKTIRGVGYSIRPEE